MKKLKASAMALFFALCSAFLNAQTYYRIDNVNSGLNLAVFAFGTADGTRVVQWYDINATHQHWLLEDVGNNEFKIRNINSKKLLAVFAFGTHNGAQVLQWRDVGGGNERWRLENAGNNEVYIRNVHSGKVLDINNWSTSPGTILHQWDWHGGANQRWRLTPIGVRPPIITATTADRYYINMGESVTINVTATSGSNELRWLDLELISSPVGYNHFGVGSSFEATDPNSWTDWYDIGYDTGVYQRNINMSFALPGTYVFRAIAWDSQNRDSLVPPPYGSYTPYLYITVVDPDAPPPEDPPYEE